MNEIIETEKWHIIPKKSLHQNLDESYVELVFRLKSDMTGLRSMKKEDLEELENDLKDIGKWRRFRHLKRDLEDER